MVQFPRTAQPSKPANRSYESDEPAGARVRRDLYTRYHRNTIQRDLLDQQLYVASDTGAPASDYWRTDGHWDAAELPQPTDDPSQLRADLVDWGYCLVSDALSPAQLEALRRRVDRSCGRVCIKCPPSHRHVLKDTYVQR
jgi:hypothetical protein